VTERELAWRIFAEEFNRADLRHSKGADRAPHYIITPTGAKCNRLFVVGVATEIDNIGAEEEASSRFMQGSISQKQPYSFRRLKSQRS